jgi:hypothetical protein
MKPIFYLNGYRIAAFCATFTRLLRRLQGFSPLLIFHSKAYTTPFGFIGINSLQKAFGSVSFTIVPPFFCVISSSFFSTFYLNGRICFTINTTVFRSFSYTNIPVKENLFLTTNSNKMVIKNPIVKPLKKIT